MNPAMIWMPWALAFALLLSGCATLDRYTDNTLYYWVGEELWSCREDLGCKPDRLWDDGGVTVQ